jgi:hypothetical protein
MSTPSGAVQAKGFEVAQINWVEYRSPQPATPRLSVLRGSFQLSHDFDDADKPYRRLRRSTQEIELI